MSRVCWSVDKMRKYDKNGLLTRAHWIFLNCVNTQDLYNIAAIYVLKIKREKKKKLSVPG